MAILGYTKLEALFRKAASLDIDKGHAKEITDIIEKKLVDFLIAAERNANLNGRDIIWEADLPITKGLQETIIEFKKLEEEIDVQDVLNYLTTIPPLKYPLAADLEAKLPELTGAILVVMARIMKEIDRESRRVNHELIERAGRIMDLTL
ncbi:DUF1931 family protein [Nitratifractor salsuginis]|uniref:DUF1931 family protein n=1 Tax=Nitratifractor salsuginis (strain DSM 16511 / JCM 12458 / E9I37-1) TaxID=749222 RepID=E6X1K6_NITSE|nr:DUF1931 family protein [Nitratifractor salsuginis]ADV45939.1 Domain of unknown function DUF1931 [Nitratifractor salsuginis DSM 16511]